MIFTIQAISGSLASYLAPELPGVTFYDNPNQQGTKPPAVFLRRTNARIAKKMGDRFLRTLGLDLVYLEEFNQVGMEDRYTAAADILDQMLEIFPYTSMKGGETALLRTYERKWDIINGDLHYKFNLKVWVSREEDAVLMRSIQSYQEEVS